VQLLNLKTLTLVKALFFSASTIWDFDETSQLSTIMQDVIYLKRNNQVIVIYTHTAS